MANHIYDFEDEDSTKVTTLGASVWTNELNNDTNLDFRNIKGSAKSQYFFEGDSPLKIQPSMKMSV